MLSASDSQRRVGAASQHGHHRRQPAAANALHLLPRYGHAVQQTRAGYRLRRRSPEPIARWPFSARANIASPPIRRTCAWPWPRSKRPFTCAGPKGERSIPIADFHLLPGNTPQRETVLEPGDLITHVTLPPPAPGSQLALSETARPRVVRIRARVRGGRDRRSRTEKSTRARIALGGVGHEALAVAPRRKPH